VLSFYRLDKLNISIFSFSHFQVIDDKMVVVFEELHDLKGVWSELAKIWEQVRTIIYYFLIQLLPYEFCYLNCTVLMLTSKLNLFSDLRDEGFSLALSSASKTSTTDRRADRPTQRSSRQVKLLKV
jgi:hypothetical protein